ncbi:MAG: GDP-mannose 4,6-dehydratase [archaeon]
MTNSLITGITGFAGSHLAELLLEKGHEVYGLTRWRSDSENIKHIQNNLKLIEADLHDAYSMKAAVKESEPDYIFHLAAQSFVPASWRSPADTMHTNLIGELNLFEAVRESDADPTIQIACSSEEYGMVMPDEVPIKETNPLRPLSPYAVSKVAQDYLGYQYFQSYGVKVIRTRAFNHTGPRRGSVFVCSNFAKQIVDIENNKKDPIINVGNLTAKRDFTDVRDTVRAYLLAVEKCEPGDVYNICSGTTHPIQEVLDKLLGMSDAKIEVKEDPERMRPSDVQILLGDNTKFCKQTGWKPEIDFDTTLKDILEYWRNKK